MSPGRAHDGGMLIVLLALVVLGLGVWFWMWLYRWANDVRDSLRQIAAATGGAQPSAKGLMKPVVPAKR